MIKQAFILAAGLGTRMRELTKEIPKPMIEVEGKSLITRVIDQLIDHGVKKIVINVFYKADRLMKHVKTHMQNHPDAIEVLFSEESELLDVGGGIINALKYLENKPFFVVNSDPIFIGKENVFSFLNKNWKNSMKMLFLLSPLEKTIGHNGKGDFFLDNKGQLAFSANKSANPPYVYISACIAKPEIFSSYKVKKTKLMDVYKKFLQENVLQNIHGLIYPGQWLHVGTPESLEQAIHFMKNCKKPIHN